MSFSAETIAEQIAKEIGARIVSVNTIRLESSIRSEVALECKGCKYVLYIEYVKDLGRVYVEAFACMLKGGYVVFPAIECRHQDRCPLYKRGLCILSVVSGYKHVRCDNTNFIDTCTV